MTNLSDTKRKVICLIRVSGKEQAKDDRTGIPRQLADVAIICKDKHLEVVHEYRLEGISGAHVESSPDFRAMLADLSRPEIAGVVFATIDRFFRPEFLSQYSVFKQFEKHHKLMFCDLGELDPTSDRDIMMITISGNLAGMERKRIAQRTQFGIAQTRKENNRVSDPLPQGVIFIPDSPKSKTGHFEYTDYARNIIKEAFRRILAHGTLKGISEDLGFHYSTCMRTSLSSRWWVGEKSSRFIRDGAFYREDGTRYDGRKKQRQEPITVKTNLAAEPLVSIEDYEAVMAIFAQHKKQWTKRKSNGNQFLGTGIVFCPCGSKMYAKTDNRGKPNYYICSTYYNNKTPCGPTVVTDSGNTYAGLIPVTAIDHEITAWVFTRLRNKEKIRLMVRANSDTGAVEVAGKERTRLEKQIATLTSKRTKLVLSMEDLDPESMQIVKARIAELTAQMTDLKAQLTTHDRNHKTVSRDTEDNTVDEIYQRLIGYSGFGMDEKKALLAQVFSRFDVDAVGTITGYVLTPSVFKLAVVAN